jgi:ADP-heptose:LPS heptosyltransferase
MKKTFVISPYSKKMRNGKENPKNYPYWEDVVSNLKSKNGNFVVQVGIEGERKLSGVDKFLVGNSLKELEMIIKDCDAWASVDNFFQHLASNIGKRGVVVFGQSDPKIFGHKENENLLKDRKFLKPKQFDIWERTEFNKDAFVEPQVVVGALERLSTGG